MNNLYHKFCKYGGLYKYGYTMFHAIFDVALIGLIAYLIAIGFVALMV